MSSAKGVSDIGHLYVLSLRIVAAELKDQTLHMFWDFLLGYLGHHLRHPVKNRDKKNEMEAVKFLIELKALVNIALSL